MTDDANLRSEMGGQGVKCSHAACQCTVAEGEQFCSDHCRQMSASRRNAGTEAGCNCGHPACQQDG
jgi:hypothetical protein